VRGSGANSLGSGTFEFFFPIYFTPGEQLALALNSNHWSGVQMGRVKMNKRKINSMKSLNAWKGVLSDFNEKGFHEVLYF
jgi:hypothetical protein